MLDQKNYDQLRKTASSISYADSIVDSAFDSYAEGQFAKQITDPADFAAVFQVVYAGNFCNAVKHSTHRICDSLSRQMIASQFYNKYLASAAEHQVQNIPAFNNLMQSLLCFKLVHFYESNKVTAYLENPEYIALLKPGALWDLLLKYDQVPIQEQALFIAKNNKILFSNNTM